MRPVDPRFGFPLAPSLQERQDVIRESETPTKPVRFAQRAAPGGRYMLLTLLSPQIAPGSIVGSVNVTEAPDTLDGLGQVIVSGSLAVTEAPDTLSASGTVAGGAITGTVNGTEARDTLSAVALVTGWRPTGGTPESWSPTGGAGATWTPVPGNSEVWT